MARIIIKSLTFGTGTRAGCPADYPIRHRLQVGGVFARLIELDAWTVLFRARFVAGLMILCAIVVQEHLATSSLIFAAAEPIQVHTGLASQRG